jgi:hypothetical protein
MNIKRVKQKKQKNENDIIGFERHMSMQKRKDRDSSRLDYYRDLTHLFRIQSILIKRRQNKAIFNFVIWLIKQIEPAKIKTKTKTKTFSKSNFLRQQVSACLERNDASKRKEAEWDRRLSYD